jgi:GDP-4-dehydro-6-deoxy-D-mannose reductase
MPTAFITGINGFVGQHLSDHLIASGYRVAGTDVGEHSGRSDISYRRTDILDREALASAIAAAAPSQVYHLAGMSYPPDADTSPWGSLETNIMGVVSLLDGVRAACPAAVTLLIGSAKEYEASANPEPLPESLRPNPASFYGVSKYAGELIGLQYARQFGLDVRLTRSFNHTGPGQSPRFVCSDWARQVAEVCAGRREPRIEVGDLSPEIDFCDVRDVARAYLAIVSAGRAGEVYNVCSGRPVALRFILERLLTKAPKPVRVATVAERVRGHAVSARLLGDNSKLRAHTGWSAEIPLEKTLDDLFAYWMQAVTPHQ